MYKTYTEQKMKYSIKENFIFCAVLDVYSEPCQTSKIGEFAKTVND